MRRVNAALAAAALMFIGPAAMAQQTGNDIGVPTETQERRVERDDGFPWDLLGLLGLAGLLGLRNRDDDVVTTDARR
jgi:hypothetical protein